jgi:hypothetical protein
MSFLLFIGTATCQIASLVEPKRSLHRRDIVKLFRQREDDLNSGRVKLVPAQRNRTCPASPRCAVIMRYLLGLLGGGGGSHFAILARRYPLPKKSLTPPVWSMMEVPLL